MSFNYNNNYSEKSPKESFSGSKTICTYLYC